METPNPYQPPQPLESTRGRPQKPNLTSIRLLVLPSFAFLLVIASLSLVLMTSWFVLQITAFFSGRISLTVGIGILLGRILLDILTIQGSLQGLRLASFRDARRAATMAAIPILSPLFFLGMPFGIWALVILSTQSVQRGFRSGSLSGDPAEPSKFDRDA